MIKSALSLAVLAAVALSLPAAAQTDAVFAAALGKLPSGLATMAQLKTRTQKPDELPAVKGPAVDAETWSKILAIARENADYEEPTDGSDLGQWTIEEKFEDPKAEYLEMKFVVVGRPIDDRTTAIGVVFFAAMKLTSKPGEMYAETWIYATDHEGRVRQVTYRRTTKSLDGSIRVAPEARLDPADPKVAARYAAMIQYWAE